MWIGRTIVFALFLAMFWIGGWIFVEFSLSSDPVYYGEPQRGLWEYQVIDTMKYSRDLARERLHDESFDATIETQVRHIAETGATHVAIATPYDEEFLPFLERWVKAARAHDLKVWFRGNLSGWEGWFGYPKVSESEHTERVRQFILNHPGLFQNGDLFTPCPECENGGSGDPRQTGNIDGFRRFIIESHFSAAAAFRSIGLLVDTRLFSMNGDVAKLIVDNETGIALGNVITVDHYVETPEQLEQDIRSLGKSGARKVFLGEFGAPIPDIHGSMTAAAQAAWLDQALGRLSRVPELIGLNYWLSVGGSTALWDEHGEAQPAVDVLKKYFQPNLLYGFITDELGRAVPSATVSIGRNTTKADSRGHYELRYFESAEKDMLITAKGFVSRTVALPGAETADFVLEPEHRSVPYLFLRFFRNHFAG